MRQSREVLLDGGHKELLFRSDSPVDLSEIKVQKLPRTDFLTQFSATWPLACTPIFSVTYDYTQNSLISRVFHALESVSFHLWDGLYKNAGALSKRLKCDPSM